MTVAEIPESYRGYIQQNNDKGTPPYVGWRTAGKYWYENRGFFKWSLDFLPSDASVTQLRVKITCTLAGGSGHLTDIHPYGGDGYTYDPETDTGWATLGARCIAGTEYVDNSDALQTTGDKWFNLGEQACQDILDAKSDGNNRYSIGLHEDSGRGVATATLDLIAVLEITLSGVNVIYVTSDYVRTLVYDTVLEMYTRVAQNIVGWLQSASQKRRAVHRFSLTSLPSGSTVDEAVLREIVKAAGGASHELDIHPYNGDGQADPESDSNADIFARCASGSEYIDDSTFLRTKGQKYFTLPAQARTDIQNAKSAVNRFSLGLHEEGDDDANAFMQGESGDDYYPQLMIVYTPPPPSEGYSYNDGFVHVGILGLMRNVILSVCGKIQVAG